MTAFLARQERFAVVGSTNDVVRDWLADGTPGGLPRGRGRADGRPGARRPHVGRPARRRRCCFRSGSGPTGWRPERVWRLAATVSLAMADAAEAVAGLPDRAIRLKWPNDLVVETVGRCRRATAAEVRKLAGVLGETDGLGTDEPRVVVGLGINTDWAAADFPAELAATMTSLREASGGRPSTSTRCWTGSWTASRFASSALRAGRFDVADWADRQLTTGREVRSSRPGRPTETAARLGVDAAPARWSSTTPTTRRRASCRRRDQPRPAGRPPIAHRDGGVTRWPVRHSGGWSLGGGERPRLAHLDRDRSLVEAAQADPARFDALYRKYLAQVYSYAVYELARSPRGGGRDGADLPVGAARAAAIRGARPARRRRGRSTFRVWLFRIARHASPSDDAGAGAILRRPSRRPGRSSTRSTSRPGRSTATTWRTPGAPSSACPTTAGAP